MTAWRSRTTGVPTPVAKTEVVPPDVRMPVLRAREYAGMPEADGIWAVFGFLKLITTSTSLRFVGRGPCQDPVRTGVERKN
jgi:hypothetical protein